MMHSLAVLIGTVCGAAGIGLAAPVGASPPAAPFENCPIANTAGYCDIPAGSPYYGSWLDDDQNGIACEC